jgi:hypothetical protein
MAEVHHRVHRPDLFLRKQGVTKDWDNALINFDQKTWFPAGFAILKAIALWIHPLSQKRVDGIEQDLAARRAAATPGTSPA